MRYKLPVLASLAFLVALTAFRFKQHTQISHAAFDPAAYKKTALLRCTPDWELMNDWLEDSDIPPIPGAGIYTWEISTSNDSAQFYFNQGINMYYSFHIIEAMASFKKAARFDPQCAMLYWAQALTYGPNINDLGYIASPEALEATRRATELAENASPLEKALIRAMAVRYTADSADATRAKLNQDYTDMMQAVYQKNPSSADAQALYADAMMLQHPWDLWNTDGTPKAWTPLIRKVLEKLLAEYPNHPGGNHYYIHVMEPSPYAALALPSAERLGKTNPGLSHVVHMPSHIYLRTGYYQKGVDVNIRAVNSYYKSIQLYAPVTGADFLYIIHNLHMKSNNAMMTGNRKEAIAAAEETRKSIQPDYLHLEGPLGSYIQYIYMTPLFVDLRYGNWDDILKMEKPATSMSYANVLYHFGRGMAFSRLHKLTEASNELDLLRETMKDSVLNVPLSPFSPVIDGARVAEQLLLGAIHEEKQMYDGAVRHYTLADSIESAMVYNEPRDWILNPKQYLGNAYLEAGDAEEAENIFRKDLKYNNENGWALFGLASALKKQKKNKETAAVQTRFKKAFAHADTGINAAVY